MVQDNFSYSLSFAFLASVVAVMLSCCGTRALSSSSSSSSARTYDVVVIGGGSAGLTAAKFAGNIMKKSVVIIEQAKLGGDCTWTGCVPSKSLIASAKASIMTRKQLIASGSDSYYKADFAKVKEAYRHHQQEIYEEDDSPQALTKLGVTTISGMARFISPDTFEVTSTSISSEETKCFQVKANEGVILCTGATPRKPSIPGLDTVEYVTYEQVWDLEALPKRLTVVGAGPIGCELAQAFARLGSQVTIIGKLLPQEEPEVSQILESVFQDEGITVVKGRMSKVAKEQGTSGHTVTCTLSDKSTIDVSGDTLLLSLGRVPNVKNMGLEAVGIKLNDKSGINVNVNLQTSVKNVYAAGDCTGDRQFTHYAGFQGAIAARNILLPLTDPGILQDIPAATFTSPEIASIGYTEAKARADFGDNAVAVSSMRLDQVDRAICDGATKGILKVVHHKRNGRILGATMMAPSGGELISEIAVAMKANMPFASLAKVVHPYPSYAIALQIMAADVYYEGVKKNLGLYGFLKRLGL